MTSEPRIPRVLSIAGSDSGGGAGIQADLKAFAACRVHGMTAITAITAQNTVEVTAIRPVAPEMIIAQIRAVSADIGIDAVKIGMLGDVPTIEAVARGLEELPARLPVVLDPVMVAESGAALLDRDAKRSMIELLMPRATVITPNLLEARALVGSEPIGGLVNLSTSTGEISQIPPISEPELDDEIISLVQALHALGPAVVVVTGGHREQVIDVFFDGHEPVEIAGERYRSAAAHGSGCTHSSVLAARLAWGDTPIEAARAAKQLAAAAVRNGLGAIGAGAGPVDVLGLHSLT